MLRSWFVSSDGLKGAMVCGVDVGKNLCSGGDCHVSSAKISQLKGGSRLKELFLRCLSTCQRNAQKLA